MPSNEEEILERLKEVEREYQEAKGNLLAAKTRLMESETRLIEAKIRKDRIVEELRVHRNTTPKYEPTVRDLEIQRFREAHPELCGNDIEDKEE